MLVFSDTSPISCLASLGRLDLLEMYGEVRIVSSVEQELSHHPSESARALVKEAFDRGLLRRDAGKMKDATSLLLEHELDQEKQKRWRLPRHPVLIWSLSTSAKGVNGHAAWAFLPLAPWGILLRAKCDGRLDSVGSAMHELTRTYGFAISPALLQRALTQVGEAG